MNPLPCRRCAALTFFFSKVVYLDWSDIDNHGIQGAESLAQAIQILNDMPDIKTSFIIGGGEVYKEAFALDTLFKVHRTLVHGEFSCDTFIPAELPSHLQRDTQNDALNSIKEENGVRYEFQVFVNAQHPANRVAGIPHAFALIALPSCDALGVDNAAVCPHSFLVTQSCPRQ